MRKEPQAQIIAKRRWGDYILLTLSAPETAPLCKPGQFIMIRIQDQPFPLLRRPLSIHNAGRKQLEFFFQKCGAGTTILGEKRIGESLDILGPLGNGFSSTIPESAFLIGGGRGIAPLYFLAKKLLRRGTAIKVFYGGKNAGDLPIKARFEDLDCDLICTTDDGSMGTTGLVTNPVSSELEHGLPERIYACGPDPMLQKIAAMAGDYQIPAELSLESIMGCGFGACWGCVKRIREGGTGAWRKICEDGPVFEASEIIWPDGES